MYFKPHAYQTRAIEFVEDHKACALFLDMGLGKTVSTLTAIDDLIQSLEVEKVLVIAPKSVALNTWSSECEKWDHLQGTRLSIVMGDSKHRTAALDQEADIYVTNRDNTEWICERYTPSEWPFDCVVLDESSSFKNHQSKRYKAINKVRPYIKRLILLTGTPAPNGLMDLWAQVRLLDRGERLGKFIGQYREAYFKPGAHKGAVVYNYIPKAGAKERISAQIADICLSMQASDYLSMPAVIDGGMELRMTEKEMKAYKTFERECVMELEDGAEIVAVTAVALTNKLVQYASGAVYDNEHSWHPVGDTKLEALLDLLEQTGEPTLVYYNYQHELERIQMAVPDAVRFRGEPEILKRWNEGGIRVMLAHPASVAYGLNMQQGGHIIVWYSPTWNLELYQQANARLNRQGQTKPVILYHLVCKGTMDETVMTALKNKDNTQLTILSKIKSLQNEYR